MAHADSTEARVITENMVRLLEDRWDSSVTQQDDLLKIVALYYGIQVPRVVLFLRNANIVFHRSFDQVEIAQLFMCSPQNISHRLTTALRQLKEEPYRSRLLAILQQVRALDARAVAPYELTEDCVSAIILEDDSTY